MAIMRTHYRNPWSELDSLTGRLNRFLEDLPNHAETGNWKPAVNVDETAEELILTAELPGMKLEDLELEVENNVLTLSGEKAQVRTEGEDRKYHVWERTFGSFSRAFTLPRTVRVDDITAEFADGVLYVRMPKAPEARSRRIEVHAPRQD